MDNTQETIQSAQPFTEQKQKGKKTLIILLVLIIIALLFTSIAAVAVLLLSKSDNSSTDDVSQQEDSDISTEYENIDSNEQASSTTEEFNGSYIQATIPTDWNIVEYSDVNGMKYYAEQEGLTFSGLTGISILDEDNVEVFTLKGVDGIGGTGGCTELAQFSDTEASYVQTTIDETNVLGFGPTNVLDYTASNYSDISFLGKDFRRVGNVLYVDMENSLTAFNAGCGLNGQFVTLNALGFTLSSNLDTYTAYAYEFKINSAVVDEETLTKLDDVLNSIQ